MIEARQTPTTRDAQRRARAIVNTEVSRSLGVRGDAHTHQLARSHGSELARSRESGVGRHAFIARRARGIVHVVDGSFGDHEHGAATSRTVFARRT